MRIRLVKEQLSEIIDLFENKLHSLQMVATKFNCSRQYIKRLLNAAGISTSKERSRVKCQCVNCGKEFSKPRARKRNQTGWNDYCSRQCYYKAIEGFGFPDNGVSRREARLKMAIQIIASLKLPEGSIIHHIDGNQANNDARNLILFASQSAHLRFHRHCPVEPTEIIFDGRIDSPEHRLSAREKVYTMLGQRF